MGTDRRITIALGLDVFVVTLFVAIGRRNHDEGTALAGVIETATPFLIGLAAAWVITRAWRHPYSVITGLVIWPLTVLIGMTARRMLFDDGTATSFVVVATVFLGATLVGWRALRRVAEHRRRRQMSGDSLMAR